MTQPFLLTRFEQLLWLHPEVAQDMETARFWYDTGFDQCCIIHGRLDGLVTGDDVLDIILRVPDRWPWVTFWLQGKMRAEDRYFGIDHPNPIGLDGTVRLTRAEE